VKNAHTEKNYIIAQEHKNTHSNMIENANSAISKQCLSSA